MILLSANNANTTLAAGISSSTTTLVLATGTGALFPSPGTNQYFPLTLNDALTGLVYEICWCTSRTGDNLTVLRGQEGTTARAWLLGDYAYNANTAGNIQTGRAFSAANNPTLPFTVPATHNGITQICAATGTITLPAVSGIVDGFLCPIVCNSSGATITVNTNSAAVSLPTGNTSTTFTVSGMDSYIILQWNLAETMWNTVSASPQFYSQQKPSYTFSQSGSISSISTNTVYTVASGSITFPSYSKTGAFRISARLVSSGSSTGSLGNQNFINKIYDGTTTIAGAAWIAYIQNSGALWGFSDTINPSTTYSPGSTITFTHTVSTLGGGTSASISGCYMQILVSEA